MPNPLKRPSYFNCVRGAGREKERDSFLFFYDTRQISKSNTILGSGPTDTSKRVSNELPYILTFFTLAKRLGFP